MADLIREAPIGQLLRWVTNNRILKYPEELPEWQCPTPYVTGEDQDTEEAEPAEKVDSTPASAPQEATEELDKIPTVSPEEDEQDNERRREGPHLEGIRTRRTQISRVGTRTALQRSVTQKDLEAQYEQALAAATMPSRPIIPDKLEDGTILVDWYATDDPANPQNWNLGKKLSATLLICLYTMAVYMGSSIYAPSELGVMKRFGVGEQAASLGLSMYVLGYGIGPILFSPLSEIPFIGRNPPYMLTYAIFVILIVPTALVNNFAGLIVLRFLLGFFGSPCLATGGASLQDMFSFVKIPYAMSAWAVGATLGPSLGPLISGFSVTAENWRWSLWEMLWLSGPVFIVMFLFLPETNPSTILLRRAQRMRAKTGNTNLKSQSEIDQGNMRVGQLVAENLYRPLLMMIRDPAVGFTALYTALVYGIYYSFFESFPLVYGDMYGFSLGEMGLTFLSITVGVAISVAIYWSYVHWVVEPHIRAHGFPAPEYRLRPALISTFLCPIGLFMFGWTANPKIHWIVSVIGVVIFTVGIFIVIQCIFLFLPLTYPVYAASLFAGNDLTRSALAAGAIHFSRPLFGNLGVGKGISILGGLCAGCIVGLYALWYYGPTLRAKSRFAAK